MMSIMNINDPFLTLFGVFYVVVGLSMLLNKNAWADYIRIFADSKGACLLGGVAALFIGMMILLFHYSWDGAAASILTVIGYIAAIKGLFLLLRPAAMQKLLDFKKLYDPLWPVAVFAIIMGGALLVL